MPSDDSDSRRAPSAKRRGDVGPENEGMTDDESGIDSDLDENVEYESYDPSEVDEADYDTETRESNTPTYALPDPDEEDEAALAPASSPTEIADSDEEPSEDKSDDEE